MSELRNLDWKKLLKSLWTNPEARKALLKSKSLQWATTIGLREQGLIVLDASDALVLNFKGSSFNIDLINYPRIFEAWDRYQIDKLQPGWKVLDAGSNIGSYSIPALVKGCEVTSVEPLFFNTLKKNISLNSFSTQVTLLEGVLSNYPTETPITVDCQEYLGEGKSINFSEVLPGDWDAIRLDLGGEEWSLNPRELLGTPKLLEIEFHFWNSSDISANKFLIDSWAGFLKSKGYNYRFRWSVHKHWCYLSAYLRSPNEEPKMEIVHLPDASFRGESLKLWKI